MSEPSCQLESLLEKLTGQPIPLPSQTAKAGQELLAKGGMGYSQLNEILLTLGYDLIKPAFFQFILDGRTEYESGSAFPSLPELEEGIDRFRKHAMLRYGNIKYAFKNLSTMESDDLAADIAIVSPIDESHFTSRHEPVHPVEEISGEETFYLGYIIKHELDARLDQNPNDEKTKEELQKRDEIVERGIQNHEAYLTSGHMDVYVATSMRERHEFYIVNRIASQVFGDKRLKKLKLHWFDPTQAFCHDRIDKGLSEALMLKRAKCTLYLAQETDTLGKDSELASTLAQGKPVIAYVPRIEEADEDRYVEELMTIARKLYPDRDPSDLILEQLKLFAPKLAWEDSSVRLWLDDSSSADIKAWQRLLARTIRQHYDTRAETLQHIHPLAIQVNLETGVATGLLVARTPDQCAELILRVVTNRLEFDIEEEERDGNCYLLLRESVSGSIFRVVTSDAMLTNAFWNFYLA